MFTSIVYCVVHAVPLFAVHTAKMANRGFVLGAMSGLIYLGDHYGKEIIYERKQQARNCRTEVFGLLFDLESPNSPTSKLINPKSPFYVNCFVVTLSGGIAGSVCAAIWPVTLGYVVYRQRQNDRMRK